MFLIRAGNGLNDKGSSTLVFCLASNVLFEANHLVLTLILVHITEYSQNALFGFPRDASKCFPTAHTEQFHYSYLSNKARNSSTKTLCISDSTNAMSLALIFCSPDSFIGWA